MSLRDNTIDIMIDIETTGTKPGAKILGIGACTFGFVDNRAVRNYFVCNALHVVGQEEMDEDDPATMEWWSKQSKEAYDASFNNPDAVLLPVLLANFSAWVQTIQDANLGKFISIWGKGATFDLPIIEEACKRYNITIPWSFRANMCYRTLEALGLRMEIPLPEKKLLGHIALNDAMNQATYAELIFAKLRGSR